ncbi:hypothetical protein Y032_0033g2752 [Ancylostoma ceylanicum]|uniref:Uncharacterized protein n=1 Tax=Ancylostoma ceylanicum TaxID=53326 RepID=A0A016UML6_9BILA|nr:hypothetical protein Y032_0033g2752 [Ancylostoma ceylanicum]
MPAPPPEDELTKPYEGDFCAPKRALLHIDASLLHTCRSTVCRGNMMSRNLFAGEPLQRDNAMNMNEQGEWKTLQ